MSLNRYAKTRDANEPEIVDALRKAGASVEIVDKPVDLIVGFRGQTFLFDVKLPLGPRGGDPSKHGGSTLTDDQARFFNDFRGGMLAIVRSPAEALKLIEAAESESGHAENRIPGFAG